MKCSCHKYACFGLPNDKTSTCCSKCKTEDMINIKNKKCQANKDPYNIPCET